MKVKMPFQYVTRTDRNQLYFDFLFWRWWSMDYWFFIWDTTSSYPLWLRPIATVYVGVRLVAG